MPEVQPNRRNEIAREIGAIATGLESAEEVQFAMSVLQRRGAQLRRFANGAMESLSRQFLQQRHQIFPDMPGPWPVEFKGKLEVWHRKEGFDFTIGKTWVKKWTAEISAARFVRLGARDLARYVELEVPVEVLIPKEDRAEYGFKEGTRVAAFCTLAKLVNAGPAWVMDTVARVRIARARAIAAQAANTGDVK